MTRLLDRLEHALGHTSRRPSPRHRLDRRTRFVATPAQTSTLPRAAGPASRPVADPADGFVDCRGEWHAWEDAS